MPIFLLKWRILSVTSWTLSTPRRKVLLHSFCAVSWKLFAINLPIFIHTKTRGHLILNIWHIRCVIYLLQSCKLAKRFSHCIDCHIIIQWNVPPCRLLAWCWTTGGIWIISIKNGESAQSLELRNAGYKYTIIHISCLELDRREIIWTKLFSALGDDWVIKSFFVCEGLTQHVPFSSDC